jgi:hypothetical protein
LLLELLTIRMTKLLKIYTFLACINMLPHPHIGCMKNILHNYLNFPPTYVYSCMHGDVSSNCIIVLIQMNVDSGARRSARTPNSPAGDLLELPRSSRRQSSSSSSTGAVTGSPSRSEKPEKPRQSRRSTKSSLKDSSEGTKSSRQQPVLPLESSSSSSPARSLADIPKKTRRKKSKEYSNGGGGGSTRSARLKAQATEETYQSPFSDPGPGAGSVSTSRNNELLSPQPFEGGSRKGYMGGIY